MQDFFAVQDRARRQSGRLVVLFTLAILGILLSTYLVTLFVADSARTFTGTARGLTAQRDLWRPELFGFTLLIVLAVTGLAGLYRLRSLRGGGAGVAELLGARVVPPGSQEPGERRLVNVVEEMALAAGIPVPQVYVLDGEPGINAFAAGYSQNDAAITVTSGLLETLDRDELQGVVAHELGHVLSGDMRLKCRLISALFGISALAIIGRVALQALPRMELRKGSGLAVLALVAVAALMLLVIGALGSLMGRAIKAAVSRQREYLADASAVQFTRDPSGLAGALKKIARGGSRLRSARAQEMSHLFIAASGGSFLSRLMATHPPLTDRIRRLDPDFAPEDLLPETVERAMSVKRMRRAPTDVKQEAQALVGRVGSLDAGLLALGSERVSSSLQEALEHPFGAAAALYAVLLSSDPRVRESQYALIRKHSGPALLEETLRMEDPVERLAPHAVLPCADLALPALRAMDERQRAAFTVTMSKLMGADHVLDVREFAIARTVVRRLAASSRKREAGITLSADSALEREAQVLLSVLARAGQEEPARVEAAYRAGMEFFVVSGRRVPPLLDEQASELDALGRSLDLLARAPLEARGRLLEAGVLCVLHDDKLVVEEAELIQVLAAALDLPLPPLRSGAVEISS